MKALIDGDILAFRTAATCDDTDEAICLSRLDRYVREVLHGSCSDSYVIYLTGSNNFRKEIFPEYKANRKDKVPPIWLQQCREYLVTEWNAIVSDGCEADDLLGINQTDDSVICSIDKDLLMIPGKHYNFVKNEWFDQNYFQGMKHFYTQLLMGDRSDGIPGVAGLGKVKAARLLEGCETVEEMFTVCKEQYNDDMGTLLMYGKCLWIWRKENDIWNPNLLTGEHQSNSEEEEKSDCTTQREVEISLSMELTVQENDGLSINGI